MTMDRQKITEQLVGLTSAVSLGRSLRPLRTRWRSAWTPSPTTRTQTALGLGDFGERTDSCQPTYGSCFGIALDVPCLKSADVSSKCWRMIAYPTRVPRGER